MNSQLSEEATEFGSVVDRSLESLGGFDVVRQADVDGARRADVERALAELGVWELDVRGDLGELEAAAAVCRSAGRWAAPYPVAERLAAGPAQPARALGVCGPAQARLNHADLDLEWTLCDGSGRAASVTKVGDPIGGKLGRFVVPVETAEWHDDARGAEYALTLQVWVLYGMLERALDLTKEHVSVREQFGATLSSFQHVQFSLSDVVTATQSLFELAKYTLWSVGTARPEAWTDVLALRVAALEAAEQVFRVCHQLHGATGFCDETAISWLSRYSQPVRRLPWGLSRTEELLVQELSKAPLEGPFARPDIPRAAA